MDAYDYETVAGKTVVVTGGGRGLGAAICEILAKDGARVVVADMNEEDADATAQRLAEEGAETLSVALDVGSDTDVAAALQKTVDHFGRLDAVINNAGTDVTTGVRELSVEQWERVIRTNLTGPFLVARQALEHLAPGGHIVNIASTAARRAWPNASVYHASKWGLMGLTHALHAELREAGIKVSAVIAGGMRTPFLLDRFPDIDPTVLQDPANVARAVRFVLTQPPETVIPEVMVLPMKETSWP